MSYKTFSEQVKEHLNFLRSNGLDVKSLLIDAGFVRCVAIDAEKQKRGEYAYKTQKNVMAKKGLVGLNTWFRGPGGMRGQHNTYGHGGERGESEGYAFERPLVKKLDPAKTSYPEEVESKARYLWDQAKESGRSDYLNRKGVGAYGIRFLENDYGRVAAIPARDGAGILRALQFLNPSGEKRFLKGSGWVGLFHKLGEPKNGLDIGIAESYVTAASCFELTGIPIMCAFSSGNLPAVTVVIRNLYPASRIIIFADNDRHLEKNVGILAAEKALMLAGSNSLMAFPNFGEIPASQKASDWNDLIMMNGFEFAKAQAEKQLRK